MTLWGASTSISCRTTPRSRNLLHRMLPFRRRSVNGSPPGSIGGSGQRLPDGDVNQRRDHNQNGSVIGPWVAEVHESAALTGEIDPD